MTIARPDLVAGAAVSSIGAKFKGERMRFTVDQLIVAAVSESDNTAVDALLRLVGAPNVVTRFLRSHGIDAMRVDFGEGAIEVPQMAGRRVLKSPFLRLRSTERPVLYVACVMAARPWS